MTYIDKMIGKKMEHETTETYIENFKSLQLKSGILGSTDDNTRMFLSPLLLAYFHTLFLRIGMRGDT